MTATRNRRLLLAALVLAGLALAAFLGFQAFRRNMVYFQTPSDLVAGTVPAGSRVRLGGLVERGSVHRGQGLDVRFSMADCDHRVPVAYAGILPDLFREGQGLVATGTLKNGVFVADEVLAKHDENYMPPDLAASLKAQGKGTHACAAYKAYVPGAKPSAAAQVVVETTPARS